MCSCMSPLRSFDAFSLALCFPCEMLPRVASGSVNWKLSLLLQFLHGSVVLIEGDFGGHFLVEEGYAQDFGVAELPHAAFALDVGR